MFRPVRSLVLAALAAGALALPALGQTATPVSGMVGAMRPVSNHMGEMVAEAGAEGTGIEDALRFEPYQQLEEMFFRDDVVFLMRHGPTDWSKLDAKAVAPDDCANQRVMVEAGEARMRDLGTLLAVNEVLPSRIVTSQWCRNGQTVAALLDGFDRVDPAIREAMPVETDGGLNLLLSLEGSADVTPLRALVSSWEGDPARPGPLLVVSHYTNIEELTQFRVFEGEILVIDPKRDNLVLGYVRLKSAGPDVGHFADALASPLLDETQAFDMVERYYEALNTSDATLLGDVLSERWVLHGESPSVPERDAEDFLDELARYTDGIADVRFAVEDVFLAGDVITVRGTISGRHEGTLFGVPATGRAVEFGAIAVHRVEGGAIAESWQMADRATLMRQITDRAKR